MTPQDEAAFEAFKIAQHMSRDLDTVDSLSDLVQVRIALRHGGHCDEMIDNYMHDAIEVAQERRSIGRYVRGMLDASTITFCLGVMYFTFAPDRAFAGEVQPMPMSIDWVTTISVALFFLWLVYLCLPAVRNTIHAVEQDTDDRPHGDTTGWRGDGR